MNQTPNKYEKRAALGKKGEDVACEYLQEHGFVIAHRNWRCGHKEIDIIAKKDGTLHFVEVKTRSPRCLLPPQEAVNMAKQQLLVRAAREYIRYFSFNGDIVFDIISIIAHADSYDIDYIPDAFNPLSVTWSYGRIR